MRWIYYFSGSKLLVYLEKHREVVYSSIYFSEIVLILSAYFFKSDILQNKTYLVALFGIAFISLISNRVFKSQQNWLSVKAYIAMDSARITELVKKLKSKLFQLQAIPYFAGLLLLLYPIFWWKFPYLSPNPTLKDFISSYGSEAFLKTLWQVDATIVSITFVLISLVWEFAKSNNPLEAKAYNFVIRKSKYKLITILNFLALIFLGYFSFVDVGGDGRTALYATISMTLFIFAILSTIFLFLKLFALVDPTKLLSIIRSSVKDKISRSLLDEFFVRVTGNILYDFGKDNGFVGIGSDYRDDLKPIIKRSDDIRLIEDINVGRLKTIPSKLKKTIDTKDGSKFIVTRKIGAGLDSDNGVVARLHPSDYSNKIEKTILGCFRFRDNPEIEDIRDTFESLRDQAIAAIESASKAKLNLVLDIYERTYQDVLELFKSLGAKFDFKTSHAAFIETRSLILIESTFREIIYAAFQKSDPELIKEILFFPYKLMRLALKFRDHLVFKQAVHFYMYAYYPYKSVFGGSEKGLVVDRLWKHLEEFITYNLEPALQSLVDNKEGQVLLDGYVTEILLVLNNLTKASIDRQDDISMPQFLKAIEKMFDHLAYDFRESRGYDIDLLKIDLRNTKDKIYKNEIRKKIDIATYIAKLLKNISTHKQVIYFGLGAWILRKLKDSSIAVEFGRGNIEKLVSKLGSLSDLTNIYFEVDRREVGDLYSWGWWEMEGLEEGVAHSVDKSWLTDFYCIAAINTIDLSRDSQLAALPQSVDERYFNASGLKYLSGQVKDILNRITNGYLRDLNIIKVENLDQAISGLVSYLDRGVSIKENEEDTKLRNASLDPQILKDFVDDFIENWRKETFIRDLFIHSGSYIDKTDTIPRGKKSFLGFNKFESKDLFIRGSFESTGKFADHFASAMAGGENEKISKFIFQKLVTRKDISLINFEKDLEIALKGFKKTGYETTAILLSGWRTADAFSGKKDFVPRWQVAKDRSSPNLFGYYRECPIYNVGVSDIKGELAIVDISKFANLEQYSMGINKPMNDVFWFSIEAIDEAKFNTLVSENPNLLIDNNGIAKDRAETYKEFQRYVHFRILQRFSVKIKDPRAGILLKFDENE